MEKIYFVSACAGSGKTEAALKSIKHGIERTGRRFVLAQPTRVLVHSTLERAKQLCPSVNWRAITSDEHPGEVRSEFTKAIADDGETVIIVTHAALLSSLDMIGKSGWNLIVDEVPAVDATFTKNLSITWDTWAGLLDIRPNPDCDSALNVGVKAGCAETAEIYARNEYGDDVIKVTQEFWQRLRHPHWQTVLTRSAWQTAGFEGVAQLQAHSWLTPSVLDGWGRVTIMGANFEQSLLYAVWGNLGVEFEPDPYIAVKAPAHDKAVGSRCRVMYFTERDWSKRLRDQIGFGRVIDALRDHVDDEHIWVANKDVEDTQWKIDRGTRLPPVAHGLNEYRHHRCAVFLAALNDTPSHFAWMRKQWGIEPIELSRAKTLETAYQMLMRTNLREPNGTDEVRVIVPDRRTADYLCSLLPGSKQHFLDLGLEDLGRSKRTIARTVPAKTNAERQREKRIRDAERKAAYTTLQSLKAAIFREAAAEDPIILSFEESVYSTDIVDHTFDDWDEFRDLLKSVWKNTLTDKTDNMLINGGYVDPNAVPDTVKGSGNVVHSQLLQLDFDDSDLDPALVHRLLSDIRHIIYNSYNNGRNGKFRYRVMIPLSGRITAELYDGLWDIIAQRVSDAGYSAGKTARAGKASGLDRSKRTTAAWMYMPSQAKQENRRPNMGSFWIENWDAPLLDTRAWANRLLPETPDYVELPVVDNRSETLKAMATAAQKAQANGNRIATEDEEARRQRLYEKALERWRSTPAGEGNSGFFRFAASLQSAGYTHFEIEQLLRQHHAHSQSNATDRRNQIPSIMASLKGSRRSGTKSRLRSHSNSTALRIMSSRTSI